MQVPTRKQPESPLGSNTMGHLPLPNVTLRPLTLSDIDFLLQLVCDPQVHQYIPELIMDMNMLENWLQNLSQQDHEYLVLCGEEKIGECNLTLTKDNAEIGLMLLPRFWGQGYGSAIMEKLLAMAKKLQLKELTATTSEKNKACLSLLHRYGFTKEAHVLAILFPDIPSEGDNYLFLHKELKEA